MTTALLILALLAIAWSASAWFWLRQIEASDEILNVDHIDAVFLLGPATFLIVFWIFLQKHGLPWLRRQWRAFVAKWRRG